MTYGRYHVLYTVYHLDISIFNNVCPGRKNTNMLVHTHFQLDLIFYICLAALPTVQPGQRPAAAVRGSAPPGSPRRVAPLRMQQESLQREKEEAQQKERERQAEEREKEEQREEVSCWVKPAALLGVFFSFLFFLNSISFFVT